MVGAGAAGDDEQLGLAGLRVGASVRVRMRGAARHRGTCTLMLRMGTLSPGVAAGGALRRMRVSTLRAKSLEALGWRSLEPRSEAMTSTAHMWTPSPSARISLFSPRNEKALT